MSDSGRTIGQTCGLCNTAHREDDAEACRLALAAELADLRKRLKDLADFTPGGPLAEGGPPRPAGQTVPESKPRSERVPMSFRLMRLREYLISFGPASRARILAETDMPAGTLSHLLKSNEFESMSDGRWHIKDKPDYTHVYVIIRIDDFLGTAIPTERKVTVKKVVRDADVAEQEVARLNQLQPDQGARYFSQVSRLETAEHDAVRALAAWLAAAPNGQSRCVRCYARDDPIRECGDGCECRCHKVSALLAEAHAAGITATKEAKP